MNYSKNLIKKAFKITYIGVFLFYSTCLTNVYAKNSSFIIYPEISKKVSVWCEASKIKLKILETEEIKPYYSNNANTIGLEYTRDIDNALKIGARLGIMKKKINLTKNNDDNKKNLSDTISKSKDDNINSLCSEIIVVPIMFGGGYSKNIRKNINLNEKVFLGYTFINFKLRNYNSYSPKNNLNKAYGCFTLEPSIGVEWLCSNRIKMECDFGYKIAPKIEMLNDIELGLSGITFRLNLGYKI
jgi:hypothetical protein